MRTRICLWVAVLVALLIVGARSDPADQAGSASARNRSARRAGLSVGGGEQPEELVECIRAPGVLESADTIEIHCQVEGGSTVLQIAREGSAVKKGDLLVELDASSLRDELAKRQVVMAEAQAALRYAEITLGALREESSGRLAAAELAVKVADLNQKHYLGEGGEFELQLKSVQGQVTVAAERLKVAELHLNRAQQAAEKNLVSQEETERARLAVIEARAALDVAEAGKQLLAEHTRECRAAALELAVVQAKAALSQGRSQYKIALAKAEAEIQARRATVGLEKQRLARLEEQIDKCRVCAPRDGIAVYAGAIAEGVHVHGRQPILRLPDMSRLQIRARARQSDVDRIRKGQAASIRFDAFPDRDFRGKVTEISDAPEPVGRSRAGVKEYAVLVSIEDPAPELRPGMTGVVEIEVPVSSRR